MKMLLPFILTLLVSTASIKAQFPTLGYTCITSQASPTIQDAKGLAPKLTSPDNGFACFCNTNGFGSHCTTSSLKSGTAAISICGDSIRCQGDPGGFAAGATCASANGNVLARIINDIIDKCSDASLGKVGGRYDDGNGGYYNLQHS